MDKNSLYGCGRVRSGLQWRVDSHAVRESTTPVLCMTCAQGEAHTKGFPDDALLIRMFCWSDLHECLLV